MWYLLAVQTDHLRYFRHTATRHHDVWHYWYGAHAPYARPRAIGASPRTI